MNYEHLFYVMVIAINEHCKLGTGSDIMTERNLLRNSLLN